MWDAKNRRAFLKTATTAVAAAAVGPTILHATDKAGSKRPVVGEGEFTYECHHNWGEVPSHIVWGDTHGVCVDSQGHIYIKHRTTGKQAMDSIVVFDADGKFVRSFGKEYHGGGHGIDLRKEGSEEFLYLCDIFNREVIKTTLAGEQVWKLQAPEEPGVYNDRAQYKPTNVAFAPDGGFYVGDGYGSHYIHQYDSSGKWVRTWGGAGEEPGKMRTPHGLWWDDRPGREPALVVADRANARLQYFSADGQFQSIVEGVSFPAHFDIRGEYLLIPDLHARVTIMNARNEVVAHLGYDPAWTERVLGEKLRAKAATWQDGKFIHPHDACFDANGNILVVEWVPIGRVTLLKKA